MVGAEARADITHSGMTVRVRRRPIEPGRALPKALHDCARSSFHQA